MVPGLLAKLPPIYILDRLAPADKYLEDVAGRTISGHLRCASSLAGVDVYVLYRMLQHESMSLALKQSSGPWRRNTSDEHAFRPPQPSVRTFLELLHARHAGVYRERDARRLFDGDGMAVWREMREARLKQLIAEGCKFADVRMHAWRLGGTLTARKYVQQGEWPAGVRMGVPYHPRFVERAHPMRLAAHFCDKRAEGKADWRIEDVVAAGWVEADVQAVFTDGGHSMEF